MRLHVLVLLVAAAIIPLDAASGVYSPGPQTLFYLPLDGPNAGAPEGCTILNPALLSYISDRFNNAASAIHVSATSSASDFFAIACSNTKIAANASGNFTVGYWIRSSLSIPAGGECSILTGTCGYRNLTILATNTDNGGCRKYVITEVRYGSSAGAYPQSCTGAPGIPEAVSSTSISDGVWHNFVWVFDYTNQVMTFYLDGVQNTTAKLPGPAPIASNAQWIAGAENGSFALDGDMDDFWIEDHAWTPSEIAQYSLSLAFPVEQDLTGPGVCNGAPCTPNSAPIFAAFDHWMTLAYEDAGLHNSNCAGLKPTDWGTIVDFRNEVANTLPYGIDNIALPSSKCPATGGGTYSHDYGYQNVNQTAFLADVNYAPGQDKTTLYYDAHPGFDYGFTFRTPVLATVSGCVTYGIPVNYGVPPQTATLDPFYNHVLTLVPVAIPPPEGCATFISNFLKHGTGYVMNYLHLASYVKEASPKGSVYAAGTQYGGNIEICIPAGQIPSRYQVSGCAQPNTWAPVNFPIGFSGNYDKEWRGVPSHLHFEVDYLQDGVFTPVDPYGWHPAVDPNAIDPYSTRHPGLPNMTLWGSFVP